MGILISVLLLIDSATSNKHWTSISLPVKWRHSSVLPHRVVWRSKLWKEWKAHWTQACSNQTVQTLGPLPSRQRRGSLSIVFTSYSYHPQCENQGGAEGRTALKSTAQADTRAVISFLCFPGLRPNIRHSWVAHGRHSAFVAGQLSLQGLHILPGSTSPQILKS